jgi:hypothetical protein
MEGETGPTIRTYLGWALQLVGALSLAGAAALFLLHLYQWFGSGLWPPYPGSRLLADLGLSPSAIPWLGLRQMADWVLTWSAAGLLATLGALVFYLGLCLTYEHDAQVDEAGKKRAALWGAAGRREESLGSRLASGLQSLGCVLVVLAALVGLGIGWYRWGLSDRAPGPATAPPAAASPIGAGWLWLGGLPLAVVVFLVLVRRWSYNIAITFPCDGAEYTRYRDGRFTDASDRPVVDPALVAKLIPLAEAAKQARFSDMDSRGYGGRLR